MKTTGLSSRIAVFSNPLASAGLDGMTTFKPGTWASQDFEALRVVRAHGAADAALDAHGERNFQLPAGHVVQLRGVIDQLIHRQGDKVDEHDLDNGSEAGGCRADGETHDGGFADRCVDHAVGAEALRRVLW